MYTNIANNLIDKIKHHLFEEKLPTEYELMQEYDVSRNTIRKAVDILSQKGLVRRVQGSGYYINDFGPRADQTINLTMGVSEGFNHLKLTSRVITFDRVVADEALAAEFGCLVGDDLYRVIRYRFRNRQAYTLEYAYYEREEVPFLPIEAAHDSLLEFIRNEYGVSVDTSDQYVGIESFTSEAAFITGLPQGDKYIVLYQSHYRKNNVLFNFSKTYYLDRKIRFYFHASNQS
ncbi:GntR family transcriptional regulator [Pediococcus pentosaceus]|uniref:GntR family transcriptional regulator n=1 Tax=Pediococcus pentosaceus TaxID=1255 RepID=UPI0021E8C67C|nr:GntR family transcriptional regulator [Pediococcus pentosaceus]MCV3329165.1 GntR family transcriptional regulator [Pediococcus pentosaceus]